MAAKPVPPERHVVPIAPHRGHCAGHDRGIAGRCCIGIHDPVIEPLACDPRPPNVNSSEPLPEMFTTIQVLLSSSFSAAEIVRVSTRWGWHRPG